MITFNMPPRTGNEKQYVLEAIESDQISGDGKFAIKCHKWFEKTLNCQKVLLTTSCTHALEISAMLVGIHPGDEVIMPSYTFTSTANAFVLRGAKIVFVDIRQDTMNIDEKLIEDAISDKTKAIVPVHYAGVSCDMDSIMNIADRHNLYVIEDAAQGMMSRYKGKPLGTIGHLGVYSFHETKNYTSGGEGGLLLINDKSFIEHAEIIREKGTNRNQFFRGVVDKYSWVGLGSSYLLNELSSAYLWGQLEKSDKITRNRLTLWRLYNSELKYLESKGLIELPVLPSECSHNAHIFYIKVSNSEERTSLLKFLNHNDISAVFHYIPLHSAPAGIKYGIFHGHDNFTTIESERLIRLPLYYKMSKKDVNKVCEVIYEYFEKSKNTR